MGIWQPHDFFFAALWALFAVGIHRFVGRLKEQIGQDKSMSDQEKKFCRYALLFIRLMVYFAVACCVSTIGLPLLDALLSALLGTASSLFNRYGGFAIIIGCIVAYWKSRHPEPPVVGTGDDDPVEVEYAEQEAAELHNDLGELVYNAVVDTSENTPLKRPRDAAGIETGRDKPYSMDGIMAVHQYSVDVDTPLDKASGDLIMRELQRHTNQRGKRYPQLCRDGLPPIIYDVKNNGNFIIVEVVLYSEKYKRKIEDRRKARIARQQRQGDIFDSDF